MMAYFNCPHCGQNIPADKRQAGMLTKCPRCEAEIEIPREGRGWIKWWGLFLLWLVLAFTGNYWLLAMQAVCLFFLLQWFASALEKDQDPNLMFKYALIGSVALAAIWHIFRFIPADFTVWGDF
jgi:hypothetical protein